jgi:hypothetical protein
MKILLLILLFLSSTFAQAQFTFQKTYGGSDYDAASAAAPTSDGGFIVIGQTVNFGAGGNYGMYLVRTDREGDTLFTKVYCGLGLMGRSVIETSDRGFLLSGFIKAGFGNTDFLVLKTDSTGVISWKKSFGATSTDAVYSVRQTIDGGYIIGGTLVLGSENAAVIKMDAAGNVIWDKIYGGGSLEGCRAIQQTSDGGYILAGYASTYAYTSGYNDVYVIKMNSAGDTVWSRSYGGPNGYETAADVKQTSDGGYIVCGSATSFGAGGTDVYVIKLTSAGDTTWTRTYGGSGEDYSCSVVQTADGGYAIAGVSKSFGATNNKIYLLKINSSGGILYSKTFGGLCAEECASIIETDEQGLLIAGSTCSFGAGDWDAYLIKTDAAGNSGCHEQNVSTITGLPPTSVKKPRTSIYSSVPSTS